MLEDVLPLVESKYRVKPDRASRAIAGLSMGGGQSLSIGLRHADRFSAVGAFSAAVPENMESLLPAAAKAGYPKLWFACGKDDFLFQRNNDLDGLLTKHQVPHTYRATGGAHTYTVWRKYLAEFTPLLFK